MEDITKVLSDLKRLGKLPSYIEHVRFPRYKDLLPNTRIEFAFPLTAFIGCNGTRKSSVLKGIQGCPKGRTPEHHWFSTKLDSIDDVEGIGNKTSIVHGYKLAGNVVECIKVRTDKKDRRAEYWEPAKPTKVYGFIDRTRRDPIDKNVVYLNFRSMLPAFDKCFYYSDQENVQQYIRNRTPQLTNAIKNGTVSRRSGKVQNEVRVLLASDELKAISHILSKNYQSGIYIRHRFFDGWADTVVLGTSHHSYSEAWAGSGEVAIAVLIHKIHHAATGSLLVLDEPEVSLHPEAQKRLKDYLLQRIKTHKHQVIISTHSPFMAEGLPRDAIKAFRLIESTGQTEVISGLSATEAFSIIGYLPDSSKKILWVEDRLAKQILEQILSKEHDAKRAMFEVRIAGPDSQILKEMAYACHKTEASNNYYLLDGDARPTITVLDSESLNGLGIAKFSAIPNGDLTKAFLSSLIKEQTNGQTIEGLGLNIGGNEEAILARLCAYLKFMETNAKFLPGEFPERLIWNDDIAEQTLIVHGIDGQEKSAALAAIAAESRFKEKYDLLTKATRPSNVVSSDVFATQAIFVAAFVNKGGTEVDGIKSMIAEIADAG